MNLNRRWNGGLGSSSSRYSVGERWGGFWFLLFLLGGLAAMAEASVEERDFDRDGVLEQWESGPGTDEIRMRKAGGGPWEKADFGLPEGVHRLDAAGRDAGLRLVDLNGDGFDDVLFSDAQRYAVHLWNKDVKPHLGWTRGWSQFVRAGARLGEPAEPPVLVGARVRVEKGELVVVAGDGTEVRRPTRELIAFDMPPPLEPEAALAAFRVVPGFRVELVAAEPVVMDPIAFDWGADGRFWVVEMGDYPLGADGKGSPGGVVKVLEDRDGDGRYERSVPFLERVPFPTSVMAWRRGVLVASAPDILYAEDADGDGRADVKRVLFTGFTPGNQQHRVNGFEWGLDGWVYAANGDSGGVVRSVALGTTVDIRGRDVRFRPDTGEIETVSVQTQYGRHRDDWGNWFGNNNPTWLWHVTVPEHYLRRNPKVAARRVMKVLANYENSTRVFPASRAMVRPNQPWSLNHVTSGSSASPYRDDLFGSAFSTSVFICEPVHNTIHREVLVRVGSGFSSRREAGEEDREFLASTDNWFRPTTVRTGPDGALYVADMYRFVLEHPEWIAPEMLARLDLKAGTDRGRIYRVVPEKGQRRAIPNLAALHDEGLVPAMDSPSGWQRDTVQRLLWERHGTNGLPSGLSASLVGLLSPTRAPEVRIQALATLGQMGALTMGLVTRMLMDPHPWIRCEALRQAERFAVGAGGRGLFSPVANLASDGDAAVRLQAAFSLGAWPAELAEPVLAELGRTLDADDEALRVAVLSSLRPESVLFGELNQRRGVTPGVAASRPGVVVRPSSPDRAAVIAGFGGVDGLTADPAHGRVLYGSLCAPCHQLHGEGNQVGPDLGMVGGKETAWLLNAILDPGQAVEARYRGWTVTLKDGETLDGLVAAETANNVVLRVAGGVEHAILRSELRSMEPARTSLMPEGFETALKPQDMADLLAWLRWVGPRTSAAGTGSGEKPRP